MTSIQLDSGGGAGGGGGGGATNLGYTPSAANGIVTSSTGMSATIPAVDATNAGLMTPAQRAALIAAAGTNLSYTASPTQGVVVSDTGTDAGIPTADAVNAGLMTPAQKAAIDALAATYQPLDADLTALAAIAGVQGDIIYRDGTTWVRLPAGTSGQFLKTNGAGANPAWATPAGGSSVVPTSGIAVKGATTYYGHIPDNMYLVGAMTQNAPGLDTIRYIPMPVTRSVRITSMAVRPAGGSGAAGREATVGIYAATEAWQPTGAPLYNAALACASDGWKENNGLTIDLTPGMYLKALNVNNAALVLEHRRMMMVSGAWAYGSSFGTGFASNWRVASTYVSGALPASPVAWDTVDLIGDQTNPAADYIAIQWIWT